MKEVSFTITDTLRATCMSVEDFAAAFSAVRGMDENEQDKTMKELIISDNIKRYGRYRRHPVWSHIIVDVLDGIVYNYDTTQRNLYVKKQQEHTLKSRYKYVWIAGQNRYVHHLVLESFFAISHERGQRRSFHTHHCEYLTYKENSIFNLRLCSPSQNCRHHHRDALGANERFDFYIASRNGTEIKSKNQAQLALAIGCSKRSISYCMSGKLKSVKGYQISGGYDNEKSKYKRSIEL